jgi:tetratricopeptide (TPR) repeat protein
MRAVTGIRLWATGMLLCLAAAAAAQSPWAESYRLEVAGDYAGALRVLEPVTSANPTHELAVLRTAWLQYLSGEYNASIREYRRALELNPDSLDAALGVSLPLLAQRRWREAAAAANQVLAVAPWNYYAHLRLLASEEGLQQWQTLARHAGEVAARFPSDASALVYLARARAWQGNEAAARAAYSQVLERIPEHEEATGYLRDHGD